MVTPPCQPPAHSPTPGPDQAADRVPPRWRPLVDRSRALLRDHQDPGGAWPAAPTFAPYGFSWFRDGSFIAEGASASGLHDEAGAFHGWCARVLEREAPAVDRLLARLTAGERPEDADYLPARYRLDGERQVDDWWNFQVDGYGTWLWALERHLGRTGGDAAPYADAIGVAARYLTGTGTDTCRDWWEENRDRVHVTTLAGVAAGLRSAVRLGSLDAGAAAAAGETADRCVALVLDRGTAGDTAGGTAGPRLAKWLDGTDLDASLLAVAAVYDVLPPDHPLVAATASAVEAELVREAPDGSGGLVHRYVADTFYGGGQWPVLGCLLAWHHLRAGDPDRAAALLDRVVAAADEDLLLPEQVPPLLAPQVLDEWLERWGPSAHPLLWSHGMFLAVTAAAACPQG